MKKDNKLFGEIYKIDESTKLYMIEIALDHYVNVFNKWDPAPFKRRDLDPDLQLYLEGSSEEIPLHYPIELCFTVPEKARDNQLEKEVEDGLKKSFVFKMFGHDANTTKSASRVERSRSSPSAIGGARK